MTAGGRYDRGGVLVTGAQGFMGSWLLERLLAEGARVVVPRRQPPEDSRFQRQGLAERCEQLEMDLLELPSLVRALNENDVELVFHLAAQTIVATANESPMSTFDANVRGTYNLLEAARLLRVQGKTIQLVVASSYHAYGKQGSGRYTDETPLRPSYPYDVSKACADMLGRSYAATYDMPVAVTRMANVYGGGDVNWSRIVPDSARALVRGERPVIASDGTPERDYLYVEDAAAAFLAVAASLDRPKHHGRAWNIGTGRPISVLELVRTLISVSDKEVEPDIRGRAEPRSEIDSQYLDASPIGDELGWSPRWQLADGLAATYEWYETSLGGRNT